MRPVPLLLRCFVTLLCFIVTTAVHAQTAEDIAPADRLAQAQRLYGPLHPWTAEAFLRVANDQARHDPSQAQSLYQQAIVLFTAAEVRQDPYLDPRMLWEAYDQYTSFLERHGMTHEAQIVRRQAHRHAPWRALLTERLRTAIAQALTHERQTALIRMRFSH